MDGEHASDVMGSELIAVFAIQMLGCFFNCPLITLLQGLKEPVDMAHCTILAACIVVAFLHSYEDWENH